MKKVLLVDDDVLLRELLGLIVQKHGYELKKAENGLDAIPMVGSFQPDLIVLDILMPVMDGREFLAQLKARGYANQNILILTSMQDNALFKELQALGVNKIATKPIAMRALEELIVALVSDEAGGES